MTRATSPLLPILIVAAAAFLLFSSSPEAPPKSPPPPRRERDDDDGDPPRRRRCPGPGPCPRDAEGPGRKPVLGGLESPDGSTRVHIPIFECDLRKNISSAGLGCCGSRSLEYAARNVGVTQLYDLPEHMRQDRIPGGDNPDTIRRKMQRYAPDARYIQDVGSTLDVLAAILATQRVACVSYAGFDPHYSGHIDHCLCVVACDLANDWVCILDNNYPEKDQLVWMGTHEFRKRWTACMNRWVYTLLATRPGAMPRQGREPSPSVPGNGEWRTLDSQHEEYSYWVAGIQRGNWLATPREYYPRLGPGQWGAPTDPPCPPPGWRDYPAAVERGGGLNYGIDLAARGDGFGPEIDGRNATRAELLTAIGPALVPAGGGGDPAEFFRRAASTPRGQLALALLAVGVLMLLLRPHGDES